MAPIFYPRHFPRDRRSILPIRKVTRRWRGRATILKAAFDGSVQFNTLNNGTIVTANEDGSRLLPYRETDTNDITVNGEINKLASTIGQTRDFAGIHWRSDYEWGLQLGEAVAVSVLRDQRNNYVGEDFEGFTIIKFDGTTITV